MFQILQERPELLGLSIDEMTGIVVAGDQFEVIGESYVLAIRWRILVSGRLVNEKATAKQ